MPIQEKWDWRYCATPPGCAGFSFRAKPSLPVLRGNLGLVVVFLAGHMINALTATDAHIAFDTACHWKISELSEYISNFDAEVSDPPAPMTAK
uniref:hypothetical protein n=1 Tax=Rhizobium ruizarguesonis TaxID=2081791 RepID=UPI0013EEC6D9